jgi:hypothetical protein
MEGSTRYFNVPVATRKFEALNVCPSSLRNQNMKHGRCGRISNAKWIEPLRLLQETVDFEHFIQRKFQDAESTKLITLGERDARGRMVRHLDRYGCPWTTRKPENCLVLIIFGNPLCGVSSAQRGVTLAATEQWQRVTP